MAASPAAPPTTDAPPIDAESTNAESTDAEPTDTAPANAAPADVPPTGGSSPSTPQSGAILDLFADLFEQPQNEDQETSEETAAGKGRGRALSSTVPRSPASLEESGLALMQICELILKQLYLQGNLLGVDIARQARLPFPVIDEGLGFLKDEKCIEVASGDLIGTASYRFNLTELGRRRAKEAFEQCRYVGPAPVSLESYAQQCRKQAVTGTACTPEALRSAFENLIIRPDLLDELGPAVCSGKSIFIYGPPGNGKTMVAKGLGTFLNNHGGDIYIPYAVQTEGNIITIYDPTIHVPTDDVDDFSENSSGSKSGSPLDAIRNPEESANDLRWRRVKRPVVITGGELTLEMLDLRYNEVSNFYTAPLHIKANGGVFLIDDFGRQIVSPRDLLNRWILPLEERIDFLSLATGKKFAVPFEQLIIFSTNLDPKELVDEAFLRRIKHKILIGSPSRDLYTEIFQLVCGLRDIEYNAEVVEFLYTTFYDQGKPPRSSDPRDLLEIIDAICRFRNQDIELTPELMSEATDRFFCQL